MANRNFPNNKLYSFNVQPVSLNCQITIGASGAVSSFSGAGIAAVTKTGAAGTYAIQLQDNYYSLLNCGFDMQSPVGGTINLTAASANVLYKIVALGTSTTFPGLPSGLTPAVGMVYVASGVGTGTGTIAPVTNSGIGSVELAGNVAGMLSKQPFTASSGGYIYFQCLAPTDAATTTTIPTNPASGSVILAKILLNNSSVQ